MHWLRLQVVVPPGSHILVQMDGAMQGGAYVCHGEGQGESDIRVRIRVRVRVRVRVRGQASGVRRQGSGVSCRN